MPYRQISVLSRHGRPNLVHRLVRELKRNSPSGPRGAPDIREESVRFTDRVMVTVVWDAWRNVPDVDRGPIILEAYEKHFGADRARLVMAALGVTREEARVIGIPTNYPAARSNGK